MNKTKIEWCDSTWNPVTGCLHGCEYCYARKIATRFGAKASVIKKFENSNFFCELDEPVRNESGKIEPYPNKFFPTIHRYRLDEPAQKTKPQNIFVCSMADLFGEWVPNEWIEQVFAACEKAPQHRYLFLTKNPKRYVELSAAGLLPQRNNMWYGTTATTPNSPLFISATHYTFTSIEPICEAFGQDSRIPVTDWVILGAETGNRVDKVIPKKEWVDTICEIADDVGLPVFMKDSLVDIVGKENMRREFPWV